MRPFAKILNLRYKYKFNSFNWTIFARLNFYSIKKHRERLVKLLFRCGLFKNLISQDSPATCTVFSTRRDIIDAENWVETSQRDFQGRSGENVTWARSPWRPWRSRIAGSWSRNTWRGLSSSWVPWPSSPSRSSCSAPVDTGTPRLLSPRPSLF